MGDLITIFLLLPGGREEDGLHRHGDRDGQGQCWQGGGLLQQGQEHTQGGHVLGRNIRVKLVKM